LQSFFGIGTDTSARLLARYHIHPTCKVGELANKQVLDLTAALSDMKIENDLRRQVLDDIKRLRETGTTRGRRHALGLPVRGQRTRTQVSYVSMLVWMGCEVVSDYSAPDQNCDQAQPRGSEALTYTWVCSSTAKSFCAGMAWRGVVCICILLKV
jgi:small subunit ribosomal protein S13